MEWNSATYRLLSMLLGMGLMSVISWSSMPFRLKRSSAVIRLIARPRWPYLPEYREWKHLKTSVQSTTMQTLPQNHCYVLPDLPMRCKYVSAFLGKSKLMTTLTAWMSIPLVKRSVRGKESDKKVLEKNPLNSNVLQQIRWYVPVQTRFLHRPFLKSWNTRFLYSCEI